VEVTFHLPGDPRPIDGVVRVVRHTTPGTETTQGMGVTFVRLPEGARERLRDYVQGRMVIQEEEVLPFSFEQPPAAP
jgi:c-di-GMP-binding flagellar brake protein YcgR